MKNTLRTPHFLSLIASLGLLLAPIGCGKDDGEDDNADETAGDGDGDPGDGDGDPTTGDGDGDPTTGDGDGDPTTGDGDGDPNVCEPGNGGAANGGACTSNAECDSCNCYIVPLLGGQCGECDNVEGDMDCADITGGGCTPPNPFENNGSTCNNGEMGGGCQTSDVCGDGLTCSTVLDLLGIVKIDTCGSCEADTDCTDGDICAPVVSVQEFTGANQCIPPGSLADGEFCTIGASGDAACMSGICSVVDIMNLAQVGACGECNDDADCNGGTCSAGSFDIGSGTLSGSTCG